MKQILIICICALLASKGIVAERPTTMYEILCASRNGKEDK